MRAGNCFTASSLSSLPHFCFDAIFAIWVVHLPSSRSVHISLYHLREIHFPVSGGTKRFEFSPFLFLVSSLPKEPSRADFSVFPSDFWLFHRTTKSGKRWAPWQFPRDKFALCHTSRSSSFNGSLGCAPSQKSSLSQISVPQR